VLSVTRPLVKHSRTNALSNVGTKAAVEAGVEGTATLGATLVGNETDGVDAGNEGPVLGAVDISKAAALVPLCKLI
jgi:hypothetical protein